MKSALLVPSCGHRVPNYRDVLRVTCEAKHLMGGSGGSIGHWLWVGEATAVYRRSRTLSRCSASPSFPHLIGRLPQLRDDLMACVCVFSCLSQPLAGTSVTSWPGALLRAEAETNTFWWGGGSGDGLGQRSKHSDVSMAYDNGGFWF